MREIKKIGFIGLGVMGHAIAANLLADGYDLHVYNRTASKADDLVANGAHLAATPKAVAEASELIITMVGYPTDVKAVYFDKSTGIFSGISAGKLVVDMTTSTPTLAKEIAEKASELGVLALDAPVSGGDIGAKNRTLTIMTGGDRLAYDRLADVFSKIGKKSQYFGTAGSGQHVKMANQIGIAGTMTALSELLVYAKAAGLPLEAVIETLSAGGANTWSLTNYGPRILKADYSPGFFVKHFIKDLKIALEESEKMGLTLPATQGALSLYEQLADKGYQDAGTQALIKLWWS
ncbi:NAD(P)-dependent oxidoreductase [Lactococcus carnosus]|uniref:NAD(P)-dependent oxidoreductase n=1 Tax=Pseudolactococcus carnosus TaxID=2749961 RepID=A0ABT0AQJ7_9LACT|nr:NAD(P)-dependent oxidoreductase [Lactococcus carnosus]SCA92027.1 2-hydroxy-3-oxopropionate reductase [Lactococcus piscium]MCJ1968273.1 NAD(P)-dependent oxidoreductase [Lactococcus carnosus]MCJ1972531.1 NAD(P)-dependent oxidoreductase [Lactococcus carnosus]MCJ1981206.1 NAD(P)-dependent oxidoreductase [Lactococcus carnosus]MCJ1988967.1 NAD(P)-dependent oxidoreductase [Lactococcus carnosus]